MRHGSILHMAWNFANLGVDCTNVGARSRLDEYSVRLNTPSLGHSPGLDQSAALIGLRFGQLEHITCTRSREALRHVLSRTSIITLHAVTLGDCNRPINATIDETLRHALWVWATTVQQIDTWRNSSPLLPPNSPSFEMVFLHSVGFHKYLFHLVRIGDRVFPQPVASRLKPSSSERILSGSIFASLNGGGDVISHPLRGSLDTVPGSRAFVVESFASSLQIKWRDRGITFPPLYALGCSPLPNEPTPLAPGSTISQLAFAFPFLGSFESF
ncbi:hypothetical protein U1Q18_015423 [Sarracenia purpurea var. burkii]